MVLQFRSLDWDHELFFRYAAPSGGWLELGEVSGVLHFYYDSGIDSGRPAGFREHGHWNLPPCNCFPLSYVDVLEIAYLKKKIYIYIYIMCSMF